MVYQQMKQEEDNLIVTDTKVMIKLLDQNYIDKVISVTPEQKKLSVIELKNTKFRTKYIITGFPTTLTSI